jgi:hypothetical protein
MVLVTLRVRFKPIRLAILIVLVTIGCGEDPPFEVVPQEPGIITAIARQVPDRQGDFLSIGVWGPGIDWVPGMDAELSVSTARWTIDSEDFSISHMMTEIGIDRTDTGIAKAFEPGDYSVVFFVGYDGEAPDRYAEVRVHVNGDRTADAPDWSGWVAAP